MVHNPYHLCRLPGWQFCPNCALPGPTEDTNHWKHRPLGVQSLNWPFRCHPYSWHVFSQAHTSLDNRVAIGVKESLQEQKKKAGHMQRCERRSKWTAIKSIISGWGHIYADWAEPKACRQPFAPQTLMKTTLLHMFFKKNVSAGLWKTLCHDALMFCHCLSIVTLLLRCSMWLLGGYIQVQGRMFICSC